MLLHKTDKAHAALQRRSDALSTLERRVLILSDGKRGLDEIAGLLGADARRAALRLVEERYLVATAMRRGLVARLSAPASATADPVPAAAPASTPDPAPVSPSMAGGASAAAVETRRSLAAAKMYILDMLQLQRGPEPARIRATLQASAGRDALVAAVLQGVRYIQDVAPASYALRVYRRIEEVLPEDALPELDAMCGPVSRVAAG